MGVDRPRLQRWEQRCEWPLAFLAAMFLAAYAWPILQPHLMPWAATACRVVDAAVWALFVVDYVVRVSLATERPRWVVHHVPDLAVIALPILRPLRLLRLVMLLRVLNRQATDSLRGRIAVYTVGAGVLLVFVSSLAVLDAERGAPDANIQSFGDALWWAMSTITTVGYGDVYPVTGEGRLVAAGLMIGGIALLGIVTATLASWLIDQVRDNTDSDDAGIQRDLALVLVQLDAMRAKLAELSERQQGPG